MGLTNDGSHRLYGWVSATGVSKKFSWVNCNGFEVPMEVVFDALQKRTTSNISRRTNSAWTENDKLSKPSNLIEKVTDLPLPLKINDFPIEPFKRDWNDGTCFVIFDVIINKYYPTPPI